MFLGALIFGDLKKVQFVCSSQDQEGAFVARLEKHTGPVATMPTESDGCELSQFSFGLPLCVLLGFCR